MKVKAFNYNCYYFWYKIVCSYFHDEKDKFQNKFLFFLNSLINIDDTHELISFIEIIRRFWCNENRDNKYNFDRNLNNENEDMFFVLQSFESSNKMMTFLCYYFQSVLCFFLWKKSQEISTSFIFFLNMKCDDATYHC